MIRDIFERTKESVKDFTSDPIKNLGYLIPILIGLITFISGVISYIKFILDGGYVNQVNATKEFGLFSGYDEKFTSGTTGMITAGIVGKIILTFICIEFILLLINYFRTSGKAKRIIMVVDLIVMGIQIVLTTAVFWIAIGNLVVSEEAAYEALKPFEGISINPKAILITYAVVTLASLICFLVLVLITRDCRWMIGYSAIALAVAYIGLPLIFLFLQNIIPLATGAIALAIIALVIFLGFKIFLGGDGESTSSGSYSSGASTTHSRSEIKETKTVEKQPYQEVKKYDLNTAFWRDKGGYGVMVPQADCIYFKNASGEKTYSCTVSDFEKGKVAIINKNKRVMSVAGCKTPER